MKRTRPLRVLLHPKVGVTSEQLASHLNSLNIGASVIGLKSTSEAEMVGEVGRGLTLRKAIKGMLDIEDCFNNMVDDKPRRDVPVLITSVGSYGFRGYMHECIWEPTLKQLGLTDVELMHRYDLVLLHPYDRGTQCIWMGHPHLRLAQTLDEATKAVKALVGNKEIERKYLVDLGPNVMGLSLPREVLRQRTSITQTYLINGSRIRARTLTGKPGVAYTLTVKKGKGLVRSEWETDLTKKQYDNLLKRKDRKRADVRKDRTCFLWADRYWELDEFLAPLPGLTLLEVELGHRKEVVEVPPFLTAFTTDVTGLAQYSNANIARG